MDKAGIAVALLTCAAFLFAQEPSGGRYQGKPAQYWIERLGSKDLGARRRAAYALWHLAPAKSALPALASALGEKDEYTRETVSKTLRKYGPEVRAVTPTIVKLLAHEDVHVRREAATLLFALGKKAAPPVEPLVAALADEDAVVRANAAAVLRFAGPDARHAVPALVKALSDDDAAVRNMAVFTLGGFFDAEVIVPPLIEALRHDDPVRRANAARALATASTKATAAVPALTAALQDERSEVRAQAALALWSVGPGPAVDGLLKALEDEDAAVRAAAINALSAVSGQQDRTVPMFVAALHDKAASVRRSAAGAFSTVGPRGVKAVPLLVNLLKTDPDAQVRSSSANALAAIGSVEAAPALFMALKDKDPAVIERSLAALETLWPDVEIPVSVLLGFLESENPMLRSTATLGLRRHTDDPKVVASLVAALDDPESWSRGTVISTLASLTDPPESVALALVRQVSNPVGRSYALWAVGRMGHAAVQAVPSLVEVLAEMKDDAGVAVWALGRIGAGAEAAAPALERLLDGESRLALGAAAALRAIRGARDERGLAFLLKALETPALRSQAIYHLGRIGSNAVAAAPALQKVFSDDPANRAAAAVALYRIQGRNDIDAYSAVLKSLGEGDWRSSMEAAIAIRDTAVGDAAAVSALAEVMRTRNDGVRYHAAEALGKLGRLSRPALAALRGALATPNVATRMVVKEAIHRIQLAGVEERTR